MNDVKLNISITPSLDVSQLNKVIQALKIALGPLGKDIKFIDEKQFISLATGTKSIEGLDNALKAAGNSAEAFSSKLFKFNQALQATQQVVTVLQEISKVGVEFESSLAAVSAITGLTGDSLDQIGQAARNLAKEFGGSATSQLASFQGILSKLGPEIASNSAALELFGRNINILSAASGDDAAKSMQAVADAMLQLGLATGTPMEQAEASTRVINALAASAQVGAAEIPQVADALLAVGSTAKAFGMDVESVNAAIQTLAVGGKTGAEAGIALRNVMLLMASASSESEKAMNKLGTSSAELGKTLSEEGLDKALEKIKQGLDKFSAAEKTDILATIFGKENVSAGSILLDNLDKYREFAEGIREGTEGAGAAFEQAKIRMNTAESFAARFKAQIDDAFISVSQFFGQGFTGAITAATQIAPLVTTMAGLGTILPVDSIKNMGTALLKTLVPGLFAAKVGQDALNASVLVNPYVLAAAGVAALVGGLFLLHDALTKTAEEKLNDAKAEQEAINAKIEANKQNQALQTSSLGLVEAFKKQGAEAMTNANLLSNLAQAYPGVIDMNKSYEENLKSLDAASTKTKAELENLKKEMLELSKMKFESQKMVVQAQVNFSQEKLHEDIKKSIGAFESGGFGFQHNLSEALFGTSYRKMITDKLLQSHFEAMQSAKDDPGLQRASAALQVAVLNSEQFRAMDAESKQKTLENLKNYINDVSEQVKLRINGSREELKAMFEAGVDDSEIVKIISSNYKLTTDEVKAMLAEQRKSTEEAKKTAKAAESIGAQYSAAAKKIRDEFNAGLSEEMGLRKQIQDARTKGEDTSKLEGQLKLQRAVNQQKFAELQTYEKISKEVSNQYQTVSNQYQTVQKKKSEYELLKQQFDIDTTLAESERNLAKLKATLNQKTQAIQLSEKQQLQEKLALTQKETEYIKQQYDVALKLYAAAEKQYTTEKSKGKLSDKTKREYEEALKLVSSYNEKLLQSQIASIDIELQIKADEEKLRAELLEIRRNIESKRVEYAVKMGILPDSAMTRQTLETLKQQLTETQLTMAKNLPMLSVSYDPVEFAKAEQQAIDLQIKIAEAEKKLKQEQKQEELNTISDVAVRKREIAISEAEARLDEELAKVKGNYNLELEAFLTFQAEKKQAEENYLKERNAMYAFFSTLSASMSEIKINTSSDSRLESERSKLKTQEDELKQSYERQEITVQEYLDKRAELFSKSAEIEDQTLAKVKQGIEAMFKTIATGLESFYNERIKKYQEYLNRIELLERESAEKQKRINDLKIQAANEAAAGNYSNMADIAEKITKLEKEKEQTTQERTKAEKNAYSELAIAAGSYFGQLVASGVKAEKALVQTALQALNAMVPIIVAQIMGKQLSQLGLAGLITATALIIAFKGLVAAAQSAVGFKKGGYTGTGNTDGVAGVVHYGEFVMNAATTSRNREALEWTHKTGGTIEEWFINHRGHLIRKIVDAETVELRRQNALLLEELREIKRLTAQGNYSRKHLQKVDLDITFSDESLVEKVESNRIINLRRL